MNIPTPRFSNMTRRELSFEACDSLAARGVKPSVTLVHEESIAIAGMKKGSAGDVQGDIKLWFEDLLASKRDRRLADVPGPVAAAFRTVWLSAVEQSNESLAAGRAEAAAQVEEAQAEVERTNGLAEEMRQQLTLAHAEIDARDAAISRLDADVATLRGEIVALNAKLGAKDERIEAITAELARKSADHAAALVELDGARKHAIVQIDQARGEARHWKEQWERSDQEARGARTAADTYRNKAGSLEASLAGVNGRLAQLQESLTDEKARGATLNSQLASEQAYSRKLLAELSDVRVAGETALARLAAAEAALEVAQESVAQAMEREHAALEEMQRLRAVPGQAADELKKK